MFTARYELNVGSIIYMNFLIKVLRHCSIYQEYCSTFSLCALASRRVASWIQLPSWGWQQTHNTVSHVLCMKQRRALPGAKTTKRWSPDLQRAPQLPTTIDILKFTRRKCYIYINHTFVHRSVSQSLMSPGTFKKGKSHSISLRKLII